MNAPAAAEAAGVTYRQLDHWIHRGYINAEGGYGTGYPREIADTEVEVLKYMALLVRHGLAPQQASQVARQLQQAGRARLGLFVITTATPTATPDQSGDTAA